MSATYRRLSPIRNPSESAVSCFALYINAGASLPTHTGSKTARIHTRKLPFRTECDRIRVSGTPVLNT